MTFWNIFSYIDWILFIIISFTVLYLGVFAFTSLFVRHSETPKTKNKNRFIIIILAHQNKSVIMTVNSILGQIYPQRLFDITVVSDHLDELTNFQLAQQPVTLLTPNFEKYSRTKGLQMAINNLPQFKIYDAVIVLEAGDVVEPEYLELMNDAYEAAGTKAVQSHKLSLNRDTTSARLSAIFEEINNSIFRRGHISLGLPSAIASSGTAFEFTWLKHYLQNAKPTWGEKEMEAALVRQHIYVDYFDNIFIYNEKVRQAEEFNRQHRNWVLAQTRTILHNVHHLPLAIINRQYDLADKIMQWLLMPRMIMMALIFIMSVVIPFVYFTAALKWWALFSISLFIFALATPDYLVDEKWNNTFFKLPFVVFSSTLERFSLGRKIKQYVNLKE